MTDDLPKWFDSLAPLVHIVGTHLRVGGKLTIQTECGTPIVHEIEDQPGFYSGNTDALVTCIMCLSKSNFGTYAPR